MNRKELTPEEALAMVLKQREYMREYRRKPEVIKKKREYQRKPEVREKRREKQREYQRKPEVIKKKREYQRKIYEGYLAAKKAGLI